jgi:hypothetical protein
MPDHALFLLIPMESLHQFLQPHEIPESQSSGDGNEVRYRYLLR